VGILNIDHSPGAVAMVPRERTPASEQIWASLRERRLLLQEYSDAPVVEQPVAPGRRSEIERAQVEV